MPILASCGGAPALLSASRLPDVAELEFAIEPEAAAAPRRLLASVGHRPRGHSRPARLAWASLSINSQPTVAAAGSGATSGGNTGGHQAALEPLPVGLVEGSSKKPYVWDARRGRLRAVDPQDLAHGQDYRRTLQGHLRAVVHDLQNAFFPDPNHVTPDYWEFARWKAVHRLFSSMSSVFATQSLLRAVGVGARRSLPAAAAINWVLKDGLGRLGRLTVATRFGESFDSDLKRFRFTTSALYCAALSLEYLTPLFPQHFLVMASLANVGKSVGLTTFIATQPAFHRSFARGENLADISAKAQAQQMVMDNIGLATAVALTHACARSERARWALPFVAFPILAVGDLYSIYRELRSIHLRTLNKERAEIIAEHWLRTGEVPSPLQVSEEERLILPAKIANGCLPLTIASLHEAVRSEDDLRHLLEHTGDERYLLTYSPPCQPSSSAAAAAAAGGSQQRPGDSSCLTDSSELMGRGLSSEGSSGSRSGSSSSSAGGGGSSGGGSSSSDSAGGGSSQRPRGYYSRCGNMPSEVVSSASSSSSGRGAGGGSSSSSSSSRANDSGWWWREAWAQWAGSRGRGAVKVALRRDATHQDILQAILQAAYLRQALQSPRLAIGSGGGSSGGGAREAMSNGSSAAGSSGSGGRSGLRSSADEDCCESCRTADRDTVLRGSQRRAQDSVQPFIQQLSEHGWQVAPFMLSSTEKRGYVMMGQ